MKHYFLLLFLFCLGLSWLNGQEAAKQAPRHYKVVHTSLTGGISFVGHLQSFADYSTCNLCVRDLNTGKTRVSLATALTFRAWASLRMVPTITGSPPGRMTCISQGSIIQPASSVPQKN